VSRSGVTLDYVLSLPERILRATAASLGGLLYEATQVLLPGWLRRSRLYRAIVAGTLRIAIELVGGATGVLPPDEVTAQELAVRKAAGIRRAGDQTISRRGQGAFRAQALEPYRTPATAPPTRGYSARCKAQIADRA
jgi:hypothetical protein